MPRGGKGGRKGRGGRGGRGGCGPWLATRDGATRDAATRDSAAAPDGDEVDESHALAQQLASAYGGAMPAAGMHEPECTSYHGGFQGTVDYILHTKHLCVLTKLPTPSRAELRSRRSLPDWWMPSDHVPIAADLRWCTDR